jgi:hypothetical protein
MLKAVLVTVAATTLVFCDGLVHETLADGGPIIRHSKKVRHICQGPRCGPCTVEEDLDMEI